MKTKDVIAGLVFAGVAGLGAYLFATRSTSGPSQLPQQYQTPVQAAPQPSQLPSPVQQRPQTNPFQSAAQVVSGALDLWNTFFPPTQQQPTSP